MRNFTTPASPATPATPRTPAALVALFALLLPAAFAIARPDYCEMKDAGQNTGESQQTIGGNGPLEHLHGTLGGPGVAADDFEDMFLINITDPLNFRARIVTGSAGPDALPQLWLFSGPGDPGGGVEGLGLLGNNGVGLGFDGALLLNESTDGTMIQITQPGLYHLAISGQAPPVARAGDDRPAAIRRVRLDGPTDGPCFGPFIAPVLIHGDTCPEMNLCSLRPTKDVSVQVTIPFQGDWTFSVCGAEWDTELFVGDDCCNVVIASDDNACQPASELTLTLPAGDYYVTVEGGGPGQCGPFDLVISPAGPAGGHVPLSTTGEAIFDFGPGFEVSGPDGAGGMAPIEDWGGEGDDGRYTVDLRGVSFINPCPGDLDESGARDFGDILRVLSNWGDCPRCPYDEDFDDYLPGKTLIPQQPCFPACPPNDSWQPWDFVPGAGMAIVSDARSRSAANSLRIQGPDDMVRTFNGFDSGVWVFTTYQYVRTTFTGTTAFIMLNTYTSSADANWSLQVVMDGSNDTVSDLDGAGVPLPLARNRWVEIRVVIDLDADTQRVFYDDEHLLTKSWSEGASGGGAIDIAAVNLFANGSSAVFYDDLRLCPLEGPEPCPTDLDVSGETDFGDLLEILGLWGPCPP